jgi:hypothetical protein
MRKQAAREDPLIRKIRRRPSDRQVAQAATKLAEKAFRRVWDNPADAVYDRL